MSDKPDISKATAGDWILEPKNNRYLCAQGRSVVAACASSEQVANADRELVRRAVKLFRIINRLNWGVLVEMFQKVDPHTSSQISAILRGEDVREERRKGERRIESRRTDYPHVPGRRRAGDRRYQ